MHKTLNFLCPTAYGIRFGFTIFFSIVVTAISVMHMCIYIYLKENMVLVDWLAEMQKESQILGIH